MPTKNAHEIELLAALANLRWSADGGTWSARVTPSQCRALLLEFDRLRERGERPLFIVARPEPEAPDPDYEDKGTRCASVER